MQRDSSNSNNSNNSDRNSSTSEASLEAWLLEQYNSSMDERSSDYCLREASEALPGLEALEVDTRLATIPLLNLDSETTKDRDESNFASSASDSEAPTTPKRQHIPFSWTEESNWAITVAGLFLLYLTITSKWGSAFSKDLLKTACPYGENETQHHFLKDKPKLIFFSLIPASMILGTVMHYLLHRKPNALKLWRLLRSEIMDTVETSLFWSLLIIQNNLPKGLYVFQAVIFAKLVSIMYHLKNPKFMDGARQVIGKALSNPWKFYTTMAEVSFFTAMSLVAATNAIIYTFIDTAWYTEHNPSPPSYVTNTRFALLLTAGVTGLVLPWINHRAVQVGWFSEALINAIYYIANPIIGIGDCVSHGRTMSPSGFDNHGWGIALAAFLVSTVAAIILGLDNTKQHYAPLGEQGGGLEPVEAWFTKKCCGCSLWSRAETASIEESQLSPDGEKQPLLNVVRGSASINQNQPSLSYNTF